MTNSLLMAVTRLMEKISTINFLLKRFDLYGIYSVVCVTIRPLRQLTAHADYTMSVFFMAGAVWRELKVLPTKKCFLHNF